MMIVMLMVMVEDDFELSSYNEFLGSVIPSPALQLLSAQEKVQKVHFNAVITIGALGPFTSSIGQFFGNWGHKTTHRLAKLLTRV